MEKQLDQEEEELWKKGNCQQFQGHLAIINEKCQNLQHKQEACLLPFNTPDCLKK
jgi:hypothetical protein